MGQAEIVLYQPQLDSLEENRLRGRIAVSVAFTGRTGPSFGMIRFSARVQTDRDARTIDIVDVDVERVRFEQAAEEERLDLEELLEAEVPTWNLVVSLDRVLASLAATQQRREAARGLRFEPPVILVAESPTVLVTLDGQPRLRKTNDVDVSRVINTPFVLYFDGKAERYVLDGGLAWYEATDLFGPWTALGKLPKRIAKLQKDERAHTGRGSMAEPRDPRLPRIVVATEPTELLVIDGKPRYSSLTSELLAVTNTDSDIFLEIDSQRYFVVLSGRWYSAESLEGPWSHVPGEKIPVSFAAIPRESEKGGVLIFVPGTEPASEALLDHQIPQTATIERGPAELALDYDGDPQFEAIPGTEIAYAVNTSHAVFEVEGRYWVCHQAVWYVSDEASGPWEVATRRPADVDALPADHRHYNTKYVYVYDATPDVVYVGYTPGYFGSYAYGGTIVYGTGWYYSSWFGTYYYPFHATWGYRVYYRPWVGWQVGMSWSRGPFVYGPTFGSYWGYPYSGYPYYGGWWGPRTVYAPVVVVGDIDIDRPGNVTSRRAVERAESRNENLYGRPENRERLVARDGAGARLLEAAGERGNDVFVDREGDVYKRADGGWLQRDGERWVPIPGDARHDVGNELRERGLVQNELEGLERDHRARLRGEERVRTLRSRSGATTPRPRGRRR